MVKTPEGAKAAVILFVAFLLIAIGYWAGMNRVESDLPRCQEDEVLFDVGDYHHDYTVNDLGCVHIDELVKP